MFFAGFGAGAEKLMIFDLLQASTTPDSQALKL